MISTPVPSLVQIIDTFARDCFIGYDLLSLEAGSFRFCLSDEHYVSTLLAVSPASAVTLHQLSIWM